MKKQIFFLCLLLGGAGIAAQTPPGVIGINTENPRGVLHIDGASTTATANPSTGTVSADQATDDVIVDAQGRIGIGHIAPEAKIDIRSDAPGAIRIQDTTEGQGKALTSDAYGTGSWGIFPSVGDQLVCRPLRRPVAGIQRRRQHPRIKQLRRLADHSRRRGRRRCDSRFHHPAAEGQIPDNDQRLLGLKP